MPTPPSAVVQPSFAPGRAPVVAAVKPSAGTAPAQAKSEKKGFGAIERPPHPATVAQKKSAQAQAQTQRPPHPATIGRPTAGGSVQRAVPARPPHPATLPKGARSVQPALEGSAFPAPSGFLRNASWEPGQALPETVQRAMAGRFGGADFSAVRVHEGRDAETLGALAFTAGEGIYFARGQYRPGTRSGQELLGRQLAYVLQQRAGRVRNPFGSGVAVVRDPALEAEAARMAGR
jgi:Domain of unknown function (DUF4157)